MLTILISFRGFKISEVFTLSPGSWRGPDSLAPDIVGHLAHSAQWDETYDYTGKRVALIGIGSSSIQILPNIQPVSAQPLTLLWANYILPL